MDQELGVSPPTEVLPAAAVTGADRPSRRRWRIALSLGAIAVTIGSVAAAGVSYSRGNEWKERTEARTERLLELQEAVERSEREVDALTEQVDELVAARTLAEGERDGALVEAEQAAELIRLSALVAADLEECVDGTEALIGIFADFSSYDFSDSSDFAMEVSDLCASARSSNAVLQELIAGL